MLRNLLRRENPAQKAGFSLFQAITDQARQEDFYSDYAAPDTIDGRFELTVLHAWLTMRRLKDGGALGKKVSQSLFDVMFESFDAALREVGVGDLVVGKKIRALAENFYGRIAVFEEALNSDDRDALALALSKNIFEQESAPTAARVADYVCRAAASISDQDIDALCAGEVRFPKVVV